jgi:tetratricopeptide (TPR) repeat protein
MNGNNVRLQNLRDFTVQIQNADGKIVGTGIAVSTDGKIVTCAHVVESALGAHPRDVNGAEVGIYFPQVRGGEEKKYSAKVNCCFREHDDDMVLLQIIGEKSPLAPEQIAVLGMADQSEGNPFRTYGYSPIGNYPATRGDGIILGTVEPPMDRNLQVDPVQLKSRDIAEGMSGAAVLDVTRNLVVGLVMERFYSAGAVQDDIGYGVDSKVLTFDPFDFVLRGEALELKPAPELRLDKDLFQQAIEIVNYVRAHRKPEDRFSWNSAPTVLPEWTGRDDLLAQITEDWNNPAKHVTGLIGFGGEGKSSLARKWVADVVARSEATKQSPTREGIASQSALAMTLDGVFWWGFYENRSIDEFLEAALNFLSGGRIDPRQVPSSSLRAQIIGAMLGAGRYLFVLDGLEVLQHQEGDQYGLLTSNDLRDLLTYFARPDNGSFCLITSRAPLLDLMDYTTYTHRDVERLSEADGVALLERLQVKGSKSQLGKVVADWDGHALTVSLLGSYLAEKYNGDIAHLADIPIPTADEPRYERVHRVLRRYDEHLTAAEREFLKLFSAFRTPVHESAFEKVFQPLLTAKNAKDAKKESGFLRALGGLRGSKTQSPITNLPITEIVNRLVTYRILHCDTTSQTYTAHPLVRNHYFTLFMNPNVTPDTGTPDTIKAAHNQIKDYYLSIAGNETKRFPTLDDLKPLIEVVHHACQAGAYDEAGKLLWERIQGMEKRIIVHQLGAYETDLSLFSEFFTNGDTTQEPQISRDGWKRWMINEIGYCLMSLGRLREAVPFYERSTKIALDMQDWGNASVGYRNLANLHAQLGALEPSAEAAHQSLDLARKAAEDNRYEGISLCWRGWTTHLLGNIKESTTSFVEAEKLYQEVETSVKYLYSLPGIQHADHLHRTGDLDYARRVTEANLQMCERNHWSDDTSKCHRVLGDLDFDTGNSESARAHYESALKIARSISRRDVLIEALLARGRFFAKVGATRPAQTKTSDGIDGSPVQDAFTDLNEALNYAVEGGYRIYEADIRVALAWAWLGVRSQESGIRAKAEATRALQMSNEMGYHWGKVDAEEVLKAISG